MKQLGISKSYCYELLNELLEQGFVEKRGIEYRLTLQGRRILDSPDEIRKVRVHNIRVICYVLQADYDKIRRLGKEVQMNNWVAYILDLNKICEKLKKPPIQAKIRINIAKTTTAIVYLPPFYASSRSEIETEAHNMFQKVRRILQLEGIILDEDWINIYIPAEYAFKVDEPLDPGTEVRLGRPAIGINGKELAEEARAWVDESEGREVENNCTGYTENYLLMPERIADIHLRVHKIDRDINEVKSKLDGYNGFLTNLREVVEKQAEVGLIFSENLKSHIPYVQNASKALEQLNIVFKRFGILVFVIFLLFLILVIKELVVMPRG